MKNRLHMGTNVLHLQACRLSNRQEPEHIHITVKEPGTIPYYIDALHFDDDPLLTPDQRAKLQNRGGPGIVFPTLEEGLLTVYRDIILGMNIPDY
jgi:protocatechuate 3,4-dioxygenase beta subunit